MVRLSITEPGGTLPAGFPESGPACPGITPEEYKALVARGVWAESGAGNWSRVAPNDAVWAGGAAGVIAKVRGKNGRKLGCGRANLPVEDRRRTRSLQLSPVAVRKLAALAKAQEDATGQRVTISMVVETWAREAAV